MSTSNSFLIVYPKSYLQKQELCDFLKSRGTVVEWSIGKDSKNSYGDKIQWQVYVKYLEKLPCEADFFRIENCLPRLVGNVRPKKRDSSISNIEKVVIEEKVDDLLPIFNSCTLNETRNSLIETRNSLSEKSKDSLKLLENNESKSLTNNDDEMSMDNIRKRKDLDKKIELQKAVNSTIVPLQNEILKLEAENEKLRKQLDSQKQLEALVLGENGKEQASPQRIAFLKAQLLQLERQMLELEHQAQFQDHFYLDLVTLMTNMGVFAKKLKPDETNSAEFKALQMSLSKIQQNLKAARVRWNLNFDSTGPKSHLSDQLQNLVAFYCPPISESLYKKI